MKSSRIPRVAVPTNQAVDEDLPRAAPQLPNNLPMAQDVLPGELVDQEKSMNLGDLMDDADESQLIISMRSGLEDQDLVFNSEFPPLDRKAANVRKPISRVAVQGNEASAEDLPGAAPQLPNNLPMAQDVLPGELVVPPADEVAPPDGIGNADEFDFDEIPPPSDDGDAALDDKQGGTSTNEERVPRHQRAGKNRYRNYWQEQRNMANFINMLANPTVPRRGGRGRVVSGGRSNAGDRGSVVGGGSRDAGDHGSVLGRRRSDAGARESLGHRGEGGGRGRGDVRGRGRGAPY